ncbi:MAG TPA: hypothetical protein VFJ43_04345 [Bacteroidia bacterium]|nr:hypothetical protein [Bacteroidia bacterium]
MGLIDNIKATYALRQIKKEAKNVVRQKVVCNIDDAKTIGICFPFTDATDFELLKKYVLYLRDLKKKVKAIGYYTTKEEPGVQYSKVDYDFFPKTSHNWYGKPTDHIVTNFIDEEFDILIDINPHNDTVLTYVAAMSRAKFKVGRFDEKDWIHDLLFDSPVEKGLKFFLRQVDTYLAMINKPAQV